MKKTMTSYLLGKVIFLTFISLRLGVSGFSLRVVGGFEAPLNFGRFHVSLQNLSGAHVCGGATISKQHLLTAAHCVYGAEPEFIKAVVGTTNLDEGGKQQDVVSINIYSKFNFTQRSNDIAILKVNSEFDPQYVDILKLYPVELHEGDSLILTGFGAQKAHGESSRQMHALELKVFSQETCQFAMRYTREVNDNMFCTFTKIGQGTCHGDSGSPLVIDNQLVGIVSWGIPCAMGFPDVHTRIFPYITWIKEAIQKH